MERKLSFFYYKYEISGNKYINKMLILLKQMNFLKMGKVQELKHLLQFPKIEKLQEIKENRDFVLVSQKQETNNSGNKYMEIKEHLKIKEFFYFKT